MTRCQQGQPWYPVQHPSRQQRWILQTIVPTVTGPCNVTNETATGRSGLSPQLDRHIAIDSAEIREILKQTISELVRSGAWLNPALRIVSSDSEFGIACNLSPSSRKLLIEIPTRCLLPLNQFELSYDAGKIQLAKSASRVTRTRQRLMELTLALYNASGKVEAFALHSPELVLGRNHPITLTLGLADGVAEFPREKPPKSAAVPDDEELKLRQFLGSRRCGTRFGKFRRVLIPIVDLLNHHSEGAGYTEDKADKYVRIDIKQPLTGDRECRINYGDNNDILDFFRYYHFVPLTVPHMYSIPVVLSPTSSSFIHIGRGYRDHNPRESHFIKKLPPRLHLNNNAVRCENIRMSEQTKSDNMSVGIEFMVKMLGKSVGFPVTEDLIRETKFNLLEANRNFYVGLIKLANVEPITPRNQALLENVVLMSERQLALLNNYAIKKGIH